MDNDLDICAKKGLLYYDYYKRGLFGPGGNDRLFAAPMCDLIRSSIAYLTSNSAGEATVVKAAYEILTADDLKWRGKDCVAFLEGVRFGLGAIGIMEKVESTPRSTLDTTQSCRRLE